MPLHCHCCSTLVAPIGFGRLSRQTGCAMWVCGLLTHPHGTPALLPIFSSLIYVLRLSSCRQSKLGSLPVFSSLIGLTSCRPRNIHFRTYINFSDAAAKVLPAYPPPHDNASHFVKQQFNSNPCFTGTAPRIITVLLRCCEKK